ncbi:MAG: WD40 repeat protein [Saprospiraceae bacterium]|jgi:WD40 repeat protein
MHVFSVPWPYLLALVCSKHNDFFNVYSPRGVIQQTLCTEWHPSGEFFVTGDYGEFDAEGVENVKLQFRNADGKKIHEIASGTKEYRNIRWSPDATQLASASEALRIWSPEGYLISESEPSDDLLWGVDWSPDGKLIITSSRQGNIVLWDNKANKIQEMEY